MKNLARSTGIALSAAMIALSVLSLGCYCLDGFQSYASDLTNATIDAGSAAHIPLTISIPVPIQSGGIGVEVHVSDCHAGSLQLNARLLRSDGTTPVTPVRTVGSASSADAGASNTIPLTCPGTPARFSVAPSEFICNDVRCIAILDVELTSATGVGPREVEARLIAFGPNSCQHTETLRNDARIDIWGR